jgi:rhodanese-related sulfurtransferase
MIWIAIGVVVVLIGLFVWTRKVRAQQELEQHRIEPEALHELLAANLGIVLLDVRQPLDLLAFPEIIPGSRRLAPKEVMEQTELLTKDAETVVYCTCPSDKTSLMILKKALGMRFTRIKFLRGGLAGWKAKGFPVEPYEASFRLDTAG